MLEAWVLLVGGNGGAYPLTSQTCMQSIADDVAFGTLTPKKGQKCIIEERLGRLYCLN